MTHKAIFNRSYQHKAISSICLAKLVLLFACCVLAAIYLTPSSLNAQSLADRFGGFSEDSDQPINIEADQLKVNDKNKTALFRGNVKAVQGGFELRSKSLEVLYAGKPGTGKSGANGKVKKLTAKGTVLVTTTDDQTASSDWAEFDVVKQTIMLGDHVILTQGKNIIKGSRLIIDLKTSQSRFESARTENGIRNRGRIQMKVIPGTAKNIKKP